MSNSYPRSFLSQLVRLLVASAVACCVAGCDHSETPGQELFELENPTRSWKVPENKPVDLDNVAQMEIDTTEIDFGVVEPNLQTTQEFVVRNTGTKPLSLKRVDRNPAVTVFPKSTLSIPPGEERNLRLAWTPGMDFKDRSSVTVDFRTNDPLRSLLHLELSGQIRSAASIYPPALHADRARPDQPTEMTVLISSQRWEEFDISEVASNLPGLTWNIEPAEAEMLTAHRAKSGWVLRAELPADLPSGEIMNKSVSLQVQPRHGEGEPRKLTIPIRGKVLRRLAVYGEGIDDTGTINFGVLPCGVEHKLTFIVKVRDKQSTLNVRDLRVTPGFIRVHLEEFKESSVPENLYRLTVTLPATAPPCVYRVQRFGKIQFAFDHPRITELTLNVDFVLSGDRRQVFAAWGSNR